MSNEIGKIEGLINKLSQAVFKLKDQSMKLNNNAVKKAIILLFLESFISSILVYYLNNSQINFICMFLISISILMLNTGLYFLVSYFRYHKLMYKILKNMNTIVFENYNDISMYENGNVFLQAMMIYLNKSKKSTITIKTLINLISFILLLILVYSTTGINLENNFIITIELYVTTYLLEKIIHPLLFHKKKIKKNYSCESEIIREHKVNDFVLLINKYNK